MDGGDDGDDDDGDSSGYDTDDEDEDEEEEEEDHLALDDSAVVIPIDEIASPPEGIKPIIPPPSTNTTTTGARITIRPQTSISLPPEAEPACRPSLVSCLSLLGESLLSVTVAYGQSLRVLLSLSAASESGSHVTATVSGSVYSATVAMPVVSEVGTPVHTLAHGG
nr:hypothetical protein [Tanacetum cinerariifolium]